MTAGALVDRALERYGQTVTVASGGGEKTVRAVVQPVTEKGETLPEVVTPLGGLDGRLWLYLGREAVETGDHVTWEGRRFRVRSGRPWPLGREIVCWWAALERTKEAVT